MPTRIVIFNAVQLLACVYALKRGGAPERWTAWLMAGAAATTAVTGYVVQERFGGFSGPLFAVDVALLLGLCSLAVRANRFWPMWVAAFQLLAIGVHATMIAYPTVLPIVYNRTAGKVAYPMILLLVIGTARHYRREQSGAEEDWSPLRW